MIENSNPINAAYTNSRLLSKTGNNTSQGIQSLANGNPESGAPVANIQKAINKGFEVSGVVDEDDVSANDYANENVISDGDNRKVAIEKLDAAFDETTGHSHNGLPGEGALVSAKNLEEYNDLWATSQTFAYTGALGTSDDVSANLAPRVAGGNANTEGVVTSPPENRVEITDASGEVILDGLGNKVYGRLTGVTSTFTLSYFSLDAGVETAYSFGAATDILVFYRIVTDSANRPTIPSNPFDFGTIDISGIIVDATPALRGVVSIVDQVFGGRKFFQDDLSALSRLNFDEENDPTGGSNAALPAPTKSFVNLTNPLLFSIDSIGFNNDGQLLFLINKTGHEVILNNLLGVSPNNQIVTGTSYPLVIGDGAGVTLVRTANGLKWRVVAAPTNKKTPVWSSYTVTHTQLQAALLTNFLDIGTLQEKEVLHSVLIAPTAQVLGTGITSYSLSLGVVGQTERFAPLNDYFGAITSESHRLYSVLDLPDFSSASTIRLTAVSEGANLDQTTAGSFTIYTLTSFIE